MTKDQIGLPNELWSQTLISTLIQLGVDHFAIAPGSRSTPLALAISENPEAKYQVHFDERGLGFFALGLAKSLNKPVALLVTSGTAVGNLLPAVMEAYHTNVPLILLTADRPPELRYLGANQTTDQIKIFGHFVHKFVDLPTPSLDTPLAFLVNTITSSVSSALSQKGPIHINCMYKEPFFLNSSYPATIVPDATVYRSSSSLLPTDAEIIGMHLGKFKRGVIVAGDFASNHTSDIFLLAEKLQWPILAESCSPLRCMPHRQLISYYDYIAQYSEHLKPDCVLHLGGHLISKRLLQILKTWNVPTYYQVTEYPLPFDPDYMVNHSVYMSPDLFSKQVTPFVPLQTEEWIEEWIETSLIAQKEFPKCYSSLPLSETLVSYYLQRSLSNSDLFIGNSLPIREINSHFYPTDASIRIFTNRGLSGIDGCIATAAGVAAGTKKALTAWIGDIAFLHDVNSLSLIKKSKFPIRLIVTNNKGGGIFSHLAVKSRAKHFEEVFATAHDLELKGLAYSFGIKYHSIHESNSLENVLQSTSNETCIVEIFTSREQTAEITQLVSQHIQNTLCSTLHSYLA